MSIRVRFPPSPTGAMHIGTARALLFNYLFARKNGGKIVFRSEDTDRERSDPRYEQEILDGLQWLGLTFDEGPYRQSERTEIYKQYFERLKESGAIYPCYCTPDELTAERAEQKAQKLPPKYSGKCREIAESEREKLTREGRQPVWRFRIPEREISFVDLIRGEVKEHGSHLADFVIRKADGQYLYHFTVVVDDTEMGITHVIRGEDHISNTIKHILLFEALGAKIPEFAHLPLLLNHDKSKMSKRDESGEPATIERFRREGYLPEAVVNYLALLGWHPRDEREFFTLTELEQEFDLSRVQKSGAIFDLERLNFVNQHYLRQLSPKELSEKIRPYLAKCHPELAKCHPELDSGSPRCRIKSGMTDFEKLEQAVALIQERLKYLAEAPAQLQLFFHTPEVDSALYPHAKMKVDLALAQRALTESLPVLEKISEQDWTEERLQTDLLALVKKLELKNGQILWPLRVALTGEKYSPGTFEVAVVLGRNETIKRLQLAIDKLKKIS